MVVWMSKSRVPCELMDKDDLSISLKLEWYF